jgi:hypothetical protein
MASTGKLAESGGSRPQVSRHALYEYTGEMGMTLLGPVSRMTYRFNGPGTRIQIDPRDTASMAGLPDLRRV